MARTQEKIKIENLIDILEDSFLHVADPRPGGGAISLKDFLMSSFAIFGLKQPSLLAFEEFCQKLTNRNVKSLYRIDHLPSDTHMRDILDEVNPRDLRRPFKKLFAEFQNNKGLVHYELLKLDHLPCYLIALDGTGYFSSDKIKCPHCMTYGDSEKTEKVRFGHHVLAASLVHPDRKEVISFCPEPIVVQPGQNKNDCELNAFKRFIVDFRREHPHLNIIFGLDALYANTPAIEAMKAAKIHYIITVKNNMGTVYLQVKDAVAKHEMTTLVDKIYEGEKVVREKIIIYKFLNDIRLLQKMDGPKVNYVEMEEQIFWTDLEGKPQSDRRFFSWVTDIEVTKDNVRHIAKGGRARWKIENETFNTLKNQGYCLEHNYGQGQKNLSINFVKMMFLAFLVDQIQQASCQKFKAAMTAIGTKRTFWEGLKWSVQLVRLETWDELFDLLIHRFADSDSS